MSLIYKLFGLGALLAVLRTLLEKVDKKDIAFWLELSGIIIAILWTAPELSKLLRLMNSTFGSYLR